MNADGGNARDLPNNPADDEYPQVRPLARRPRLAGLC